MENRKPNLFIIGASKCATTTLWALLKSHREIYMCPEKEPSYFVLDDYDQHLSSYLSKYDTAEGQRYIGEASPIYSETTVFPEVARRIYHFNSESKIIYIVRNPITRIQSVWKQTIYSGHWHEAVYADKYNRSDIGKMSLDIEHALFNYPPFLEACRYWTHLNSYRQHFPDTQILVLFYEDLKKDQLGVAEQIARFLKISPFPINRIHRNSSAKKRRQPYWWPKIPPKYQKILRFAIPTIVYNRIIKRPVESLAITSEISRRIQSHLKVEMTSILDYAGKPGDYWFSD